MIRLLFAAQLSGACVCFDDLIIAVDFYVYLLFKLFDIVTIMHI